MQESAIQIYWVRRIRGADDLEFLKIDDSYLKKHRKIIRENSSIGMGKNGIVYRIKNNPRLVVKEDQDKMFSWDSIDDEMNAYKKMKLGKEPLFSPSREVKVSDGNRGIVRPIVRPIFDPNEQHKKYFTPGFTDNLRKTITQLTYKGYVFGDGYQLGYDNSKRILQYDLGKLEKINPRDPDALNHAFRINNFRWQHLGKLIGKSGKIGRIEQTAQLDKLYLR